MPSKILMKQCLTICLLNEQFIKYQLFTVALMIKLTLNQSFDPFYEK